MDQFAEVNTYGATTRLGMMDHKPPALGPAIAKAAANGQVYQSMVKDPATGYLTSRSSANLGNQFSADKKVRFIELAKQMWPNLAAVCKMIGISRPTLTNHLVVDEQFRLDLEEVKLAAVDEVEGDMRTFAKRPQNFMDRIAIMRAYRGEIYNPKSTVTINHEISRDEAVRRQGNLAGAIDAEIVSTSTEILEAEVGEKQLEAPGPASAGAAISPAVDASATNSSNGEEASRIRDPLLDLGE